MVTKEQVKAVWKCRVEGCNYTGPPTIEGYSKLTGHQLSHRHLPKAKRGYQLVDESTGQILAQKLEEAITKGFIATKPLALVPSAPKPEALPPETKPTPVEVVGVKILEASAAHPAPEAKVEPPEVKPPEAEPEAKEKGKKEEITEPVVTPDGIFAYTIHLPADAFTLFNLAKFSGLEKDGDKPFDEWLWECVMKRFETDYKMQLVLAPVKEEVKHG